MKPLLLIAMLVAAPDPSARLAAQHFEAAEAAFARGDYSGAALAFESAAALLPHAATLLNAAEAWERAGQRAKAVAVCTRVLAMEELTPAQREEARRRIQRLEPKVGRLAVEGDEDQTVEIDGDGEHRRIPGLFVLEPGEHAVQVLEADGDKREQRVVRVSAGKSSRLDLRSDKPPLELEPSAQGPTSAAEPLVVAPPETGPPVATWVAFGVGGAALLSTAILGGLTLGAQSSYNAAPSQAAADAFFARRTGANVSLGIALVACTVGGILWAVDR
ncbi:MAG: hypothetical protein U1E65_17325 [Myxococcota bacterium]